MPWIESHSVLMRHRKLREFARELRIRPSYALGHLHALWHAALEQREDGDLSSWSDDFIAEMSDFPGDAPQYVRLLQGHGWLEQTRLIHDWLDYAGLFLTKKYSTSRRDWLVKTWMLHGREYGANKQRTNSEQLESLPNPTNQPTKPTHLIAEASVSQAAPEKGEISPSTPPDSALEWLKAAIGKAYGRPASAVWSDAEECALVKVARRSDAISEWPEILAYRERLPGPDKKYFPNKVRTLLADWTGTLDRSRVSKPALIKSTPPPAPKGKELSAEEMREFGKEWQKLKKTL